MTADRAAFLELCTAEGYLDYFAIPYDETVLRSCRVALLRLFGACILARSGSDADWGQTAEVYRTQLLAVYQELENESRTPGRRHAVDDDKAVRARGRCASCGAGAAADDRVPERMQGWRPPACAFGPR